MTTRRLLGACPTLRAVPTGVGYTRVPDGAPVYPNPAAGPEVAVVGKPAKCNREQQESDRDQLAANIARSSIPLAQPRASPSRHDHNAESAATGIAAPPEIDLFSRRIARESKAPQIERQARPPNQERAGFLLPPTAALAVKGKAGVSSAGPERSLFMSERSADTRTRLKTQDVRARDDWMCAVIASDLGPSTRLVGVMPATISVGAKS
jgi:hypothetical protein